MSIENCENYKKNNYASACIRAGAGGSAGACRARNGTPGSCRKSGRAGELVNTQAQAMARAFVFRPLPFWLYILRLFRLFRFFSISLSAARYFLKIGGNFALCWRCANNQAERITKKTSRAMPCLLFIGACVSFFYRYIARAID